MTRKRFDDGSTMISLFPFLDALSGVIGILALVISTIAAVSMKDATQVIEHPHNRQAKSPVYVECCKDGLVLHPQEIIVDLDRARKSQSAWQKRLRAIRSSSDKYLILLIRPDGLDSFEFAYDQAISAGIDLGYDALYADGKVEIRQAPGQGERS